MPCDRSPLTEGTDRPSGKLLPCLQHLVGRLFYPGPPELRQQRKSWWRRGVRWLPGYRYARGEEGAGTGASGSHHGPEERRVLLEGRRVGRPAVTAVSPAAPLDAALPAWWQSRRRRRRRLTRVVCAVLCWQGWRPSSSSAARPAASTGWRGRPSPLPPTAWGPPTSWTCMR